MSLDQNATRRIYKPEMAAFPACNVQKNPKDHQTPLSELLTGSPGAPLSVLSFQIQVVQNTTVSLGLHSEPPSIGLGQKNTVARL